MILFTTRKLASPRSVTAALSLLLALASSGCISQLSGTGAHAASGGGSSAQSNLQPCSASAPEFDPSGAATSFDFVDQLPAGDYLRSKTEVYIENLASTSGQTNGSKVHVVENYAGARDQETATTALRCRETVNAFVASQTSDVTLPVRFTKYNNGSFDSLYRAFAVDFPAPLDVRLSTANGGDDRSILATDLAHTIGAYWNSGTTWVRVSGETYAFFGRRIESGKRIYGKATFTRVALPAGSI